MLSANDLFTLQLVCQAGLSGNAEDITDMFDILGDLNQLQKRQFWNWLGQYDGLLQSRLKLAKQKLESHSPKSEPWYVKQLERARGG